MALSDERVLRRELTSTVDTFSDLRDLPTDAAAQVLKKELEKIYVPNAQSVALAQRILGTCLAHALVAYKDTATYINQSNLNRLDLDPEPTTWVITGLAGAGKSALLWQLQRLFEDAPTYQPSPHCPPRRIRGLMFLRVTGRIVHDEVLKDMADYLGLLGAAASWSSADKKNTVRRELYRQGCCAIVVDESQAIANGKTAGAAFVNFIGFLRTFGVPVIVVGNYSMCHGILAQPSQNRQRLMNRPSIVQPSLPDCPDYQDHLNAYVQAMGQTLAIELSKDTETVHWLTGGSARGFLELVVAAYELSRLDQSPSQSRKISMSDLVKAYSSSSYSSFREEIELLRSHRATGEKIRKDLVCPFKMIGEALEHDNKLREQLTRAAVSRAMLLSSMSQAERVAIADGQQDGPEFADPAGAFAFKMQLEQKTKSRTKAPLPARQDQASAGNPSRTRRRPSPTAADAARSWGRA